MILQTNLPFERCITGRLVINRVNYAHSAFKNREWGSTLRSPARKPTHISTHTHTHTHTHVHTCARARDPRTDTRSGLHTLCLHSPITDSRSYAIMIDLPAWLMTGELPSAKSDGHDFRAGRSTIRELVEARLYECAEEKRERESEDRR